MWLLHARRPTPVVGSGAAGWVLDEAGDAVALRELPHPGPERGVLAAFQGERGAEIVGQGQRAADVLIQASRWPLVAGAAGGGRRGWEDGDVLAGQEGQRGVERDGQPVGLGAI